MNSPGLTLPESPKTMQKTESSAAFPSRVELVLTDDGIVTSLDNERNSDLDETRQEINVVGENDW